MFCEIVNLVQTMQVTSLVHIFFRKNWQGFVMRTLRLSDSGLMTYPMRHGVLLATKVVVDLDT